MTRHQRLPGQGPPALRDSGHCAWLGAHLDLARRVLPGLIGVWLVVLNPSLPAPLAAQSRAQVTARARVLAVGPSREAIAAGLGAAVVGRRAAHSTLATVRIGPPPVEPIISEGGFRRRRSVVLRVDFLRN